MSRNKIVSLLSILLLLLSACQSGASATAEPTSTSTPTSPPTATPTHTPTPTDTPTPTPEPILWEGNGEVLINLSKEDFTGTEVNDETVVVVFNHEGVEYLYTIETFGEMSEVKPGFSEWRGFYVTGLEKGSDWAGEIGKTVVSDV